MLRRESVQDEDMGLAMDVALSRARDIFTILSTFNNTCLPQPFFLLHVQESTISHVLQNSTLVMICQTSIETGDPRGPIFGDAVVSTLLGIIQAPF